MTLGEAAAAMQAEGKPVEFFGEYMDAETGKCRGIVTMNRFADPDREIGFNGNREFTITEPMEIQRGHKLVMIKASKKKPVRLIERIYPMG